VADPAANAMEMEPMFSALSTSADSVVFEFGCGTGRYTVRLAASCRALVAVDFSGDSLRVLARKLDATAPVGLVQADVTRLRLAPRRFDRGISTLVSNLSGASRRADMYRIAAEALRPDGVFVFGTHYFSLVERLRGLPKEGHYGEGGIYRCYFGRREIEEEVRPYFREASTLPVQIPVPLGVRLRLPVVRISGYLSRVPAVNQLGNLLVVSAARPVAGAGQRIVSEAPVLTAPR
jgi:SAM-dependent methyltransferase